MKSKYLPVSAALMLSMLLTAACTTQNDYGLFASPFGPRRIISGSGSQPPASSAAPVSLRVVSTWRRLDNAQQNTVRRHIATAVNREFASARSRASTRVSGQTSRRVGEQKAASAGEDFPSSPDFLSTANSARLKHLADLNGRVAVATSGSKSVIVTARIPDSIRNEISATGRSMIASDAGDVSDAKLLAVTRKDLDSAVKRAASGGKAVVKDGAKSFLLLPGTVDLNLQ